MSQPTGPLWDLARQAGDRWQKSWTAMSGADMAEGEVFRYVRDVYVAAAQGLDWESAIVKGDEEWRKYAAMNNARIAAAPKTKRGPMQGHSSMSHRYTSPDFFQTKLNHIRVMINASLPKIEKVA